MSQVIRSFTVDTVAILGYLADNLPSRVDAIFSQAEENKATLIVPSITIGEAMFTLLKGKEIFGSQVGLEKLTFFLDAMDLSRSISISDLRAEGWRVVMRISLPELHDRMVVATYSLSKCKAILTNDEEITALKDVKTIWD